jgi:hypothetical protein
LQMLKKRLQIIKNICGQYQKVHKDLQRDIKIGAALKSNNYKEIVNETSKCR